jgi:glyoxylase-like metal-dependent hydrolase (beta-lactamase superfamily II)
MREIVDGVFEVDVLFVHAYLVISDNGVVLVDTGLPGRSRHLRAALEQAQKRIGDVTTILLTHCHVDHTGTVAELKRDSGAQVVAHQADAELIAGDRRPPAPNFVGRLVSRILGEAEVVAVEHRLTTDGPTPAPGFTAFHTPGHTDGHVSYLLDRGGGLLFVGDAARGGGSRLGPSPRAATADPVAASASVAKLAELDFTVAVFGHGRAVTDRAVDQFRELAARVRS